MEHRKGIPDAGFYKENESDFRLGSGDVVMERLDGLAPSHDFVYEWNQAWSSYTTHFCTAFAPMKNILSYHQKAWNQRQWDDFFLRAKERYGYEAGVGNYMNVGVDAARNYWNENHPDDKMLSFNVRFNTPEFWAAIDKGWMLTIGGMFNRDYNQDRADLIIDDIENWKNDPSSYGHVFSIRRSNSSSRSLVVDNYKDKSYNKYEIVREDFQKIAFSNGVGFYPSAYVITPARIIKDLPYEVQKAILTDRQVNSILRNKVEPYVKDYPRLSIYQTKLNETNDLIRKHT